MIENISQSTEDEYEKYLKSPDLAYKALTQGLLNDEYIKLYKEQHPEDIAKIEAFLNSEISAESVEQKIQEDLKKIETYSEQITDIPEYQEKQIASLGGNEQELADEMATIDTEIKRTKSGFFDRTKNYVLSLATMVASLGNVAASNKQEVKIPNNVKYGKPTVQDSLDLYNNSIEVENYYKNQKYTTDGPKKVKDDPFETMENDRKVFESINHGGHASIIYPLKNGMTSDEYYIRTRKPLPPLPGSIYYKKIDDNKFYQRESNNGILDTRSPMQLYDKRINPHVQQTFKNEKELGILKKDVIKYFKYDPVAIKPVSMLTKAEKNERYKKYGDKSGIPNPNKKTQETAKETTVVPKNETVKTNKIETKKDKIIYVEDKNDPRLKAYQDSLSLYKTGVKEVLYDGQIPKTFIFTKDAKKLNKDRFPNKDIEPIGLYETEGYPLAYKNPTVEVKYRPKPKLTEVGLKPIDAVKIPTEQTEVNPLANLKQKEIIKNPEKTGYTVRVGEKLYYLSKEDLNKLESDKTTHYNVSEKGDGTEKRLVWWGGNDQGQNLQQVAERLGIKLPRAFDTQRQEFDK